MKTRRDFVRTVLGGIISLGFFFEPAFSAAGLAFAKVAKTVIPRGTPRETLKDKNPKDLDTTDLEVTPLAEFKTMGLDDLEVDVNQWRLIVAGEVGKSLSMNYHDLTSIAAVERTVLLICPGFFVNNGFWKGISVKELLTRAEMSKDVNYVTFRGPEGNYEKLLRVPLDDVLTDKVFLAYQVNGEVLPQKHGFPLRVVAEGYYGYDWVKYVYKVTADVVPGK
jgi:DMSO/TMAO reductase YedYZ molybdopterin-dependent catalytic subunit